MTQTASQKEPEIMTGSCLIDSYGRILMGKQSPMTSRRQIIKSSIDISKLGRILNEINRDFLHSAFADRRSRKEFLKKNKVSVMLIDDSLCEKKVSDKLNSLIQRCRKPMHTVSITEYKDLYAQSKSWWPTTHEIILRTAENFAVLEK